MVIPINLPASENETQQGQAFRSVLAAVVSELTSLLALDVSRLEAITVAANIDSALAQFDDGGIETGRTLTRTRGEGVAAGITPVCMRAGSARCHIFFPASQVAPLSATLMSTNEQRSIARYVVAHELSHVHDLAQRARHLEPHVLKTPGDLLTPPLFWQLAEICWNEYVACRLSACTYPEVLRDFSELLIQPLHAFRPSVRATLLKCIAQGTSAPAFEGGVESLYPILNIRAMPWDISMDWAHRPFPRRSKMH